MIKLQRTFASVTGRYVHVYVLLSLDNKKKKTEINNSYKCVCVWKRRLKSKSGMQFKEGRKEGEIQCHLQLSQISSLSCTNSE
jgi:hypothetical protein